MKKMYILLGLSSLIFFSFTNDSFLDETADETDSYPQYIGPQASSKSYSKREDGYEDLMDPTSMSYLTFTYLLWQAKSDGLELAQRTTPSLAVPSTRYDKSLEDMKYSYESGFKVGTGYKFDYDKWDLYFQYLHHRVKNSKSVSYRSNGTLNLLYVDTATYHSISGKDSWKCKLHLFNLDLKKPFLLGQKVIFEPFFGLKGGWLTQKLNRKDLVEHVTSLVRGEYKGSYKSDTGFVGPEIGVNTNWFFYKNCSFYANVVGSVAYQEFKISSEMPNLLGDPSINMRSRFTKDRFTPNLDLAVGLEGKTGYIDKKFILKFLLGYEFLVFFDQIKFTTTENILHPYTGIADQAYRNILETTNVTLHGLTASLEIDW